MSASTTDLKCPHCEQVLKAFEMPDMAEWEQKTQWACFNDECPYFVSGWEWMRSQYNVRASYRYRVTGPDAPKGMPLPVPSADALLDRIIED